MSFLPTGKPYARLADFPLDPSCVYGSDAEASSYARTSPVAYAGQVISVTNPPGVYMIRSDRSLLPLFGGTVDSVAVPAEPMFPIGYVTWIGADTEIPTGWIPGDTAFSPSRFPLLAAYLGTARTPVLPDRDGLRGIMLGRFVESVRIPDTGFVETSGPNATLERQLIVASNALIAQRQFEDARRRQLAEAIGEPCLISDDWAMLLSRIRYLTRKFQNVLTNQGVADADTLKADALIDRVDRLVTAESVFRLTRFDSDLPAPLFEKNANIEIADMTLSWSYSDDTLLKTQSLTGPGAAATDMAARSQRLTPGRKDENLEYVLHATNVANIAVSRSLRIEYVHPAYFGCSPFFAIDELAIRAGTKLLEKETERKVSFAPVDGYMFFAVPKTWRPYRSATDSHGFDFLNDSFRVSIVPVTTPDGSVVPYRVYASCVCNHLDHYTLHFHH